MNSIPCSAISAALCVLCGTNPSSPSAGESRGDWEEGAHPPPESVGVAVGEPDGLADGEGGATGDGVKNVLAV